MTRSTTNTARKGRHHPASDARIMSIGIAATATFAGIAILGAMDHPANATAASAPLATPVAEQVSPTDALLIRLVTAPTVPTTAATVAPQVIVIRRVHHVAAASNGGTKASLAAWSPTPVRSATAKSVSAARSVSAKKAVVRKVVAKKSAVKRVRRVVRTKAS